MHVSNSRVKWIFWSKLYFTHELGIYYILYIFIYNVIIFYIIVVAIFLKHLLPNNLKKKLFRARVHVYMNFINFQSLALLLSDQTFRPCRPTVQEHFERSTFRKLIYLNHSSIRISRSGDYLHNDLCIIISSHVVSAHAIRKSYLLLLYYGSPFRHNEKEIEILNDFLSDKKLW